MPINGISLFGNERRIKNVVLFTCPSLICKHYTLGPVNKKKNLKSGVLICLCLI